MSTLLKQCARHLCGLTGCRPAHIAVNHPDKCYSEAVAQANTRECAAGVA